MKPSIPSKQSFIYSLISLLAIVITSIVSIAITSPPKLNKTDVPTNDFSVERAFKHIEYIAKNPHMTGTSEHDVVCNYIVNQLDKLGLEVEIQNTTISETDGYYLFANVTNVIGKIKGTKNSKALLIVGHYDTQPYTPGAADDGLAVGAMLEAAEIISRNYSVENDIIFLFTDAEEIGLLGAEAFAKEHRWMNDVGMVLNLEARGNSGAVLAFEVSEQNGWLIREFAKATQRPFAASMMYEVYKMLPNNTDFTVFKNRGYTGINLALVKGFVNYHSPTDSPENLSLRSLQHMGDYVLSIAKHFGNISLFETKGKDLVFFNIIGHQMIYYPATLNVWLLIAIAILLGVFLFIGFKRYELKLGKITFGLFVSILSVAAILGIVFGVNFLIKRFYPHYDVFYSSNFYNVEYYFLAFSSIATSVFLLIFFFILRKVNYLNIMASVFILFTALSVFLLIKVPTASYILQIPLFFGLLSLLIVQSFRLNSSKNPLYLLMVLLIGLLPTLFLLSPYIDLLFTAFGLDLPFIGVALLVILLFFALPILNEVLQRLRHGTYLTFVVLSIVFLFIAHLKSLPNKDRPLQSNVIYALNNDIGEASWLSWNLNVDSWNNQFFINSRIEDISDIYPWRKWLMLKSDADTIRFSKPCIEIIEDTRTNDIRQVEFSIVSKEFPTVIDLFTPNSIQILNFSLDGKPLNMINTSYTERIGHYYFRIFNPNFTGHKLKIEYKGNSPLSFTIVEKKLGLPNFDYIKPIPSYVIPATGFESSVTLVANSFEL